MIWCSPEPTFYRRIKLPLLLILSGFLSKDSAAFGVFQGIRIDAVTFAGRITLSSNDSSGLLLKDIVIS